MTKSRLKRDSHESLTHADSYYGEDLRVERVHVRRGRGPEGEAFIDEWEDSYQLVQLGSAACSKAERECFARLGISRARDITSQTPDCDIINLNHCRTYQVND